MEYVGGVAASESGSRSLHVLRNDLCAAVTEENCSSFWTSLTGNRQNRERIHENRCVVTYVTHPSDEILGRFISW
jgi:hypothetical protein